MVQSVSGWTRGVQVKLWDPLRTRAIPERLRGVFTTRRYNNTRLPLPLPLPIPMCAHCVIQQQNVGYRQTTSSQQTQTDRRRPTPSRSRSVQGTKTETSSRPRTIIVKRTNSYHPPGTSSSTRLSLRASDVFALTPDVCVFRQFCGRFRPGLV